MEGGAKNDLCQLYSTQSSPVKSLNLNIPSPTVETSLASGNNNSKTATTAKQQQQRPRLKKKHANEYSEMNSRIYYRI
jgi:hypothetical protein